MASIISMHQERTNTISAFSKWNNVCKELGIQASNDNDDDCLNISCNDSATKDAINQQQEWTNFFSEYGLTPFYPHWFIQKVRDDLAVTGCNGDMGHTRARKLGVSCNRNNNADNVDLKHGNVTTDKCGSKFRGSVDDNAKVSASASVSDSSYSRWHLQTQSQSKMS
jgi:hypothetical protein